MITKQSLARHPLNTLVKKSYLCSTEHGPARGCNNDLVTCFLLRIFLWIMHPVTHFNEIFLKNSHIFIQELHMKKKKLCQMTSHLFRLQYLPKIERTRIVQTVRNFCFIIFVLNFILLNKYHESTMRLFSELPKKYRWLSTRLR